MHTPVSQSCTSRPVPLVPLTGRGRYVFIAVVQGAGARGALRGPGWAGAARAGRHTHKLYYHRQKGWPERLPSAIKLRTVARVTFCVFRSARVSGPSPALSPCNPFWNPSPPFAVPTRQCPPRHTACELRRKHPRYVYFAGRRRLSSTGILETHPFRGIPPPPFPRSRPPLSRAEADP